MEKVNIIGRIGRFSAKHKAVTLIIWLLVITASVLGAKSLQKPMSSTFNVKGLTSITTLDHINSTFGNSGNSGNIVFAAPKGEKLSSANQAKIAQLSDKISKIKGVSSVSNPFTIVSQAENQIATVQNKAVAEARAQVNAKIAAAEQTAEQETKAKADAATGTPIPALEAQAEATAKSEVEAKTATALASATAQAKAEVNAKAQPELDQAKAAQSLLLSSDGRIGYLPVKFDSLSDSSLEQIAAAVKATSSSQLQVETTSALTQTADSKSNPLIGLVLAFIILLVSFGALWAAGTPLVSSIVALIVSMMAISAATHFVSLNSVAPVLAMLIGLAVGIDYSLFIVNRFRQLLLEGMEPLDALTKAVATAGAAVVFAAVTVIITLAGLAVAQVQFLTQMGLSAAAAVFVAMLAAISFTPTILAIRGKKILSSHTRKRLEKGQLKAQGRHAKNWAKGISKHPVIITILSILVLAGLAFPVSKMQLGLPNDGTQPSNMSQRRAYDLMSEGFGAGINGPILVLANFPSTPSSEQVSQLSHQLKGVSDVKSIISTTSKNKQVLLTLIPKSGPSDRRTQSLVSKLRSLPTSPAKLEISGSTAVDIDISQRLANSLPLYLLLIVGFAFLMILIVFRSLLVPLKAVLSFLLSLGVSLGTTVAVYQRGWAGKLFKVDPASPILCFLPIIVIGVLFGLSMDYEIFLLTGIRERIDQGDEAKESVIAGYGLSAKVVVAAALIMLGVFGTGIYTSGATTKPIAFALAVGVLVDAFVVRLILLPALMTLFEKWAWALPKWLSKILPKVNIE